MNKWAIEWVLIINVRYRSHDNLIMKTIIKFLLLIIIIKFFNVSNLVLRHPNLEIWVCKFGLLKNLERKKFRELHLKCFVKISKDRIGLRPLQIQLDKDNTIIRRRTSIICPKSFTGTWYEQDIHSSCFQKWKISPI